MQLKGLKAPSVPGHSSLSAYLLCWAFKKRWGGGNERRNRRAELQHRSEGRVVRRRRRRRRRAETLRHGQMTRSGCAAATGGGHALLCKQPHTQRLQLMICGRPRAANAAVWRNGAPGRSAPERDGGRARGGGTDRHQAAPQPLSLRAAPRRARRNRGPRDPAPNGAPPEWGSPPLPPPLSHPPIAGRRRPRLLPSPRAAPGRAHFRCAGRGPEAAGAGGAGRRRRRRGSGR